jgi:hypothetical protein
MDLWVAIFAECFFFASFLYCCIACVYCIVTRVLILRSEVAPAHQFSFFFRPTSPPFSPTAARPPAHPPAAATHCSSSPGSPSSASHPPPLSRPFFRLHDAEDDDDFDNDHQRRVESVAQHSTLTGTRGSPQRPRTDAIESPSTVAVVVAPPPSLCCVCMTAPVDARLVPCNHTICCTCSTRIDICPFCRAPLEKRLRPLFPACATGAECA